MPKPPTHFSDLEPRELLTQLYWAAVRQALPSHTLAGFLPPVPKGRTLVLGAGKAGGSMAHAFDALWPQDAPMSGLVVTRYGHTPPRPADALPQRIEVVEAAHPVPDAAGLAAAQRILALTEGLTKDDLVICLISGGGSSLLTLPAQWEGGGISLEDKQRINTMLLESGASIQEMNCVRKHLSAIKGGRLAAACYPAQVVTLLISDVPGDAPSVIASGPTVPDPTSCADALSILKRLAHISRGLETDFIVKALEDGTLETPKPGDPVFARNQVHLIATPQQSLEAAAAAARAMGLTAHILSDEMEGESREVGKVHAALARAVAQRGEPFARPCVILSGGETTVTIRPRREGAAKGRGGRAGEFCMGLAQALQGQAAVWGLAADTDGIDGVEDNAGAFVAPDTLARAKAAGTSLADCLDRNDAVGFFQPLGDVFTTGPTHTNVNDFRALLVL
ncbi:hydroxypyruvate reductase [Rhodoferax saidenbachensis]|uniref:Hydroxypyruvate reductase n=2 Tax=Rhodoferax saidenbachensis TaxID=1484693 RepID=A0ABU1ZRQ7_9BURK|nr:glycerate kinase [Rhodoferax saidenbachensis]MDR7308244.1 hydroxypyruvate reductase [Rhodoferax saidenbachensis]